MSVREQYERKGKYMERHRKREEEQRNSEEGQEKYGEQLKTHVQVETVYHIKDGASADIIFNTIRNASNLILNSDFGATAKIQFEKDGKSYKIGTSLWDEEARNQANMLIRRYAPKDDKSRKAEIAKGL